MDSDMDSSTVGLLTLNPLNVKHELSSITLNHFAGLLSFVVATNNLKNKQQQQQRNRINTKTTTRILFISNWINFIYHDFIILTNGNAAHVVLLAQVLAERGAHDLPSDVRRRGEVSKAVLSSRARNQLVELHFFVSLVVAIARLYLSKVVNRIT